MISHVSRKVYCKVYILDYTSWNILLRLQKMNSFSVALHVLWELRETATNSKLTMIRLLKNVHRRSLLPKPILQHTTTAYYTTGTLRCRFVLRFTGREHGECVPYVVWQQLAHCQRGCSTLSRAKTEMGDRSQYALALNQQPQAVSTIVAGKDK